MAQDERELAQQAQDAARRQYAEAAKRAIESGQDGTYTVQPGDTLEDIAQAIYGDDRHAASIFDASLSSGAIGSDPDAELAGGTVLRIPVVAAEGQPSQDDVDAVASDQAADRPVGDRAPTTADNPNARVGGVGGDVTPADQARGDEPADQAPAESRDEERSRLQARLAELDTDPSEADTGTAGPDDQAGPADQPAP